MTCGVYMIINKVNNKMYVGQSKNIENRIYRHKNDLNNNKHHNKHLQRSWNRYGRTNFQFKILKECEINELDKYEKYYIKKWRLMDENFGYNNDSGGSENKILSKRTRYKISLNHHNVEGSNNPMYGKKHTLEARQKIRRNMRDVKGSNNPMYGKKHTLEARQKIGKIHKGKKLSEEHILILKEKNSGKNSPNWKDYPRIVKAGTHHNQEPKFMLMFNNKRVIESTNKKMLEDLISTDAYLYIYYKKYGDVPDNYAIPHIILKEMPFYERIGEERIKTNYYRVTRNKDHHCKQGFVYVYRWKENNKNMKISRVDINKLKEEVQKRGLKWEKIK